MGRLAPTLQVRVEIAGDAAREEHLARLIALALDAEAALRPVDVRDVDGEGLAATQTAVVDQPEEGAVARGADAAQHGLDPLRVQGAGAATRLGATLQADERVVGEVALGLTPAHQAAQGGVAAVVRTGREVLLRREEGGGRGVRERRRDGLVADVRE